MINNRCGWRERRGAGTPPGGLATITGSTFTGNSATVNGGAIYANTTTRITMKSSWVGHNTAEWGGGIYLVTSIGQLTSVAVVGNTAAGCTAIHPYTTAEVSAGGGISLTAGPSSIPPG